MQFDQGNMFSNQQAIVAPARSTNVLDRGASGVPKFAVAAFAADMGKGNRAKLRVQLTETFAGAFTALTVTLECDDNVGFSSPKIIQSQTLALAACLVGTVLSFDDLPVGTDERYISFNYALSGTATATAGKITAGVVTGNDEWFR
jgi:hypothetical protein